MKHVLVCCWIVMVAAINVSAQGWRGIVPLHTDCETAKRVLGIEHCRSGTYQLAKEAVTISFSDGTCETGWNVPSGTVLSLYVHSQIPRKFAGSVSDVNRYVKSTDPHVRSVVYYENKDEGVSIAVFADDTIANIFYGPALKDSSLRCHTNSSKTTSLPPTSRKFDEFRVLDEKAEKRRVDDFATQLNAWTTVGGHIVAFTGRRDGVDGLSRAVRIKGYLVQRGIAETRISITDGGIKEESTIELYVVLRPEQAPHNATLNEPCSPSMKAPICQR